MSNITSDDQPKVSEQERRKNIALREHHGRIEAALAEPGLQDEKLKVLAEAVRPADLAELLPRLPEPDQLRVIQVLDLRRGAVTLKRSRAHVAAQLIARFERKVAASYIYFTIAGIILGLH